MNTYNYTCNPCKIPRYLAPEIQQDIRDHCRCPRISRDQNGNRIYLSCNSQTCPCEYCRRIAARRISNKHQHDASIEPITYYGTLSYTDHTHISDPDKWANIRRKVMQTLRQHKTRQQVKHNIRVRFRVEFTNDGKADVNIFLKTTFPSWRSCKVYIRPIIRQASGTNDFKLYLRPPQSQVATIKYATKDMADRHGVACPPPDWKGRRIETGHHTYFHGTTQSKYTVLKRDKKRDRKRDTATVSNAHYPPENRYIPQLNEADGWGNVDDVRGWKNDPDHTHHGQYIAGNVWVSSASVASDQGIQAGATPLPQCERSEHTQERITAWIPLPRSISTFTVDTPTPNRISL